VLILALLGNSFAWWDFPHNGAGFLASWDLLYLVSKGPAADDQVIRHSDDRVQKMSE